MSLRLATLFAAATVLLGGCAGGDFSGFDDLSVLSNALPVDVIYDKASPATAPDEPAKAAAWGETTVNPPPVAKTAAWGETTVSPPPVTKVADWGQTAVYPGGRMVSPVPVGPPRDRTASDSGAARLARPAIVRDCGNSRPVRARLAGRDRWSRSQYDRGPAARRPGHPSLASCGAAYACSPRRAYRAPAGLWLLRITAPKSPRRLTMAGASRRN